MTKNALLCGGLLRRPELLADRPYSFHDVQWNGDYDGV